MLGQLIDQDIRILIEVADHGLGYFAEGVDPGVVVFFRKAVLETSLESSNQRLPEQRIVLHLDPHLGMSESELREQKLKILKVIQLIDDAINGVDDQLAVVHELLAFENARTALERKQLLSGRIQFEDILEQHLADLIVGELVKQLPPGCFNQFHVFFFKLRWSLQMEILQVSEVVSRFGCIGGCLAFSLWWICLLFLKEVLLVIVSYSVV